MGNREVGEERGNRKEKLLDHEDDIHQKHLFRFLFIIWSGCVFSWMLIELLLLDCDYSFIYLFPQTVDVWLFVQERDVS